MIIEKKHPDYQIRELTCSKEAGNIGLRWRFKEATDFLIFIYDSRQGLAVKDLIKEIQAAGMEDAQIIDSTKKILLSGKDAYWKLAHIGKGEFVRNGKCFRLPASELKKDVPCEIRVFACSFHQEKEEISVYEMNEEENTCFLPVKIKEEIRYKKKFFSKDKYCILRLPRIEDYRDGAILYHVDGVESDFPLPQSCLGRELILTVPKSAKVSIRIREEEKKYYKKG